MKELNVTILTVLITIFALSTSAMATPLLSDIIGYDYGYYADTGAEAVTLTDTDGTNDDSTFFLYLELAGLADSTTFGIYSYTIDEDGNITVTDTLEIFEGSDSPSSSYIPTSVEVTFDLETGTATCGDETASIGSLFGFYITTAQGYTYYSQTSLNEDEFDHFLIFDTEGKIGGADVVVAIEDWYGGGDQDYDDMVIGATDVAPVPEPMTLVLLGSGLLGMGIFRKKKDIA